MKQFKKTKSAKILLEYFEQTKEATTVVKLVELFHQQMNKTTIYRTLEQLEAVDILHSFIGKNGRKWYAKSRKGASSFIPDLHPHFQCKKCGKTTCLNVEVSIPSIQNYHVNSMELLLVGQCPDCQS